MKPIFVCVKVGEKYGPEYVNRLARMVHEHTIVPHEFLCLTDNPLDLECASAPIGTTLPGWWSKLILFKPHRLLQDRRIIYLDLDTIIINNIDFLVAYDGDFAILRDFYFAEQYGSAIMLIKDNYKSPVWSAFNEEKHLLDHWGDQSWIYDQIPAADRLQDLFPSKIVSYKADHVGSIIPAQASIICFHGYPKPHELKPDNPLRIYWELRSNVYPAYAK